MGGTGTALTGPDLVAGVAAADVKPGDKLLGHANGEAVLLARIGDDFVAIGATCSHYGGPLAEGAIVGDTVRCPWHHACFSLRTGEALRAPALSNVPCWRVERRGDRVVVTEKVERDPLAPTYPLARRSDGGVRDVVIVGAGAAGTAAAEMLRRCGFEGRVTVVDEESDSPYDRPNLSKDYLAGNAPEEWIPLRPPKFYAEHRIDIIRGRATRLDLPGHRLELDGRDPLPYDALLLATGAEPVKLGLPGEQAPHVHYLRSLADSRSIIAALGDAKRAVVIGGSFIGLETAASLRTRGLEVHVVAPEAVPLERVMGRALGDFIRALHEEKGVTFHLGRKPARIEKDAVVLDDDTRLGADLVVIGVGVRPRLALGRAVVHERAERVCGGRHRALAGPAHGRTHSRRALGRRTAHGAGGGAEHPRRGRAVRLRAVLLERALRREHQLRRPRRAMGRCTRRWRCGGARRRGAVRARGEAAGARDDLPGRGESGVRDRAGARGPAARAR